MRRFVCLSAFFFALQCAVLFQLVRVADEELVQRLFFDTAPHLTNSILTDAQGSGSLRDAFRAGADRFRAIYPGATVLLVDEGGRVLESRPESATGMSLDMGSVRAVVRTMPALPVRIGAAELPSRVFSAAPLRHGLERFTVVIVPELRVMRIGLGGFFKFFLWALLFGAAPWLAAFCGFRALLNWISRTLSGVTAAIRARRVQEWDAPLAHELAELRSAVATQQQRLERLSAETTAIEAGGRSLLPRLLHDLQTPYSVICGYGELLASHGAKPIEHLAQLRLGLDRVGWFVETLRDFVSRSGAGVAPKFARVEVSTLVEEVVALFSALAVTKGVVLRHEVIPDAVVDGDRAMLVRAVSNLVENAIKFTPTGGEVSVVVERGESGVRVRVRDTGPGIAPEHQRRLGDEFFRVAEATQQFGEDPGGSGLGLANVKDLLKAHSAELLVESELGAGATFSFVLPYERIQSANAVPVERPETFESGSECMGLLFGYAVIGGLTRHLFGAAEGIVRYELGFAAVLAVTILCGSRIRAVRLVGIAVLSILAGLILRDGEVKNLARDLLFGFYHLIAAAFVFARLREPLLRIVTFGPLTAVIGGLEIASGPRVLSALLIIGLVTHILLLRAGDLSVSRRLARRSAIGIFSLLFVCSVPGVYSLARGFERAELAQSRTAVGELANVSVADALLLAPDVSVRSGVSSVDTVAPVGADGAKLFGASELVLKLANRMIQPSLFAGTLAMIPCGLLLSLFVALTIQRRVSSRLQRLTAACRSAAPETAIADCLSELGERDEVSELGESLLEVYTAVATTVHDRKQAIERRAAMVGRLVDELSPTVAKNRLIVERLEGIAEPHEFAAVAEQLSVDLRRQAAAIGSFFQLTKLTPSVSESDCVDGDGVVDTIMDLAAKVKGVCIENVVEPEADSQLALSPDTLKQILLHGIGATRFSANQDVLVQFENAAFELRTEAATQPHSDLERYVHELHIERLAELLAAVNGSYEKRVGGVSIRLPLRGASSAS